MIADDKPVRGTLHLGLALLASFIWSLLQSVYGDAQLVPQLLNYQGRVTVDNTNFNGTGSFKFALVNGDGSTTYWSNDGTSSNGGEPTGAVPLNVTKGLYSVLLGDANVANMTGIPLSVFDNSDVRLRVWFNDGVHGSQLLGPDQRIASSGYAMLAATVPDSAITSSKIAAGAVTQANLASNAVGAAQIIPGAIDFTRLAVTGSAQAGKVLGFDGNGFSWTTPASGGGLASVSHDSTLAGNGTSGSPLALAIPLSYNASSSSPLWYMSNSGSGSGLRGDSVSGIGVQGLSTNSWGVAGISTNNVGVEAVSANSYGVVGISSGSGFAGIYGGNNSGDGVFGTTNSATGAGIKGTNTGGGYAGYFAGNLYAGGNLVLDTGSNPRLYAAAAGGEQNRYLNLLNTPASPGASGLKAGGLLVSDDFTFADPGKRDLIVQGNVGVGTASPQNKLTVQASGYGFEHTNGFVRLGTKMLTQDPRLSFQHAASLGTISLDPLYFFTSDSGPSLLLDAYGNVGIGSYGVYDLIGTKLSVKATGHDFGIYVQSGGAGQIAGYFLGDVQVHGTLTKSGGSFKIDHPLDPEHKYLYHSFVESPDMMNIYDGVVVTNGNGDAVVTMPDWFEALNRDFRYQLTVIGQFVEAIVSSELKEKQFAIKTDKPDVKVSWQVTGIRQDAWANAHRIPVEEDKSEMDRDSYLFPEGFGQPEEKRYNPVRKTK